MSGSLTMSIPFAKTFAKMLSTPPRPRPIAYMGDELRRVAVHSSGLLPREVESDANRDQIETCANAGTCALIDFSAASYVFAKAYYQKYASVGALVPGEQFPIGCSGWGLVDLAPNMHLFGRSVVAQQSALKSRLMMPARIATPAELFAAVLILQQSYGIDLLPSHETHKSIRAVDAASDACHICMTRSAYGGKIQLHASGGEPNARIGAIGIAMLTA